MGHSTREIGKIELRNDGVKFVKIDLLRNGETKLLDTKPNVYKSQKKNIGTNLEFLFSIAR